MSNDSFQQALQYHQRGQLEQALKGYLDVLQQNAEHIPSLNNLGLLWQLQEDFIQAETYFKRVLELKADFFEALFNLGTIYQQQDKLEEARAYYQQTLKINPGHFRALFHLGTVAEEQKNMDQALSFYQQSYALQSHFLPACLKIAESFQKQQQLFQSITYYQKLLKAGSADMSIYFQLAKLYQQIGLSDQAADYFKKAFLHENEHKSSYFSAYLGSLRTQSQYSHKDIFRLASTLNSILKTSTYQFQYSKVAGRIKVGYLSPDFCNHSAAAAFGLLYEFHNHERFEIFSFSQSQQTDSTTEKFKRLSDHWFDIEHMSSLECAHLIHASGIDILVDLAGHTANHRLDVFALKPAPIQMTGLGYGCTTGLNNMDYRFSDKYITPPKLARFNTEKILYLSSLIRWSIPPVQFSAGPLPCLKNNYITFGCSNALFKLNPRVLNVWAKILLSVPESRLYLKSVELEHKDNQTHLIRFFEQAGVESIRLLFAGKTSKAEHIMFHQQIDIALDPFPYNGGIISCETLWMGVPIITLEEGSRSGFSLLSILDLVQWVARNEDDYVNIAVNMAREKESLQYWRLHLRERLEHSIICNGQHFTREVENSYLQLCSQKDSK